MTTTDALLAQAIEAARAGDLDGAAEVLERAVEEDPACRRGWSLLGAVHRRRGDETLAKAAFREAGRDGAAVDEAALLAETAWTPPGGVLRAEARQGRMTPLGAGLLAVPVEPGGPGTFTRMRSAVLHAGALAFAVAPRRRKGVVEETALGGESDPVYRVEGEGVLLLRAPDARLTVLDVFDDAPLYARESAVAAFEGALAWENGRLPGGGPLHTFVEFQGRGRVALSAAGPIVAAPVAPARPARAAADVLVGWIGRVVPIVEPAEDAAATVLCEGQGSILLDPAAPPRDAEDAEEE